MKDIKIIVNNGGVIESVYVSPELKNADIEIIDFCTYDTDEEKEAEKAMKEVEKAEKKKQLIAIY